MRSMTRLGGLVFMPVLLRAQQPLETETARLPPTGTLLLQSTFEYQRSPQGTEQDVPFALEYGVAPRLAVLVEPVLYTAIRPKGGPMATGPGDLEVTAQYLARRETSRVPAIAVATEIKLPTATDRQIGTGRTDFTPYLILSKALGERYDLHANVGYSFVGKPRGVVVQNTLNVAVALEAFVTPRLHLMGEVLSTTAAAAGENGGEGSPTAPEIAGAEQVGMLGARYALRRGLWIALGATYDNTNALLVRPGLTLELPF